MYKTITSKNSRHETNKTGENKHEENTSEQAASNLILGEEQITVGGIPHLYRLVVRLVPSSSFVHSTYLFFAP
jgi:hypothetical protein